MLYYMYAEETLKNNWTTLENAVSITVLPKMSYLQRSIFIQIFKIHCDDKHKRNCFHQFC